MPISREGFSWGHTLGTEERLPENGSPRGGIAALPDQPGAHVALLPGSSLLSVLKAVKGHCQICFASPFMLLRGW